MPLWFLIPAGIAGLVGLFKGGKAVSDQQEAGKVFSDAKLIAERWTANANTIRDNCNKAINGLGEKKAWILDNTMTDFLNTFEQIHGIELSESVGLDELKKFHLDKQTIEELKHECGIASSIAKGALAGGAAGAATAFGAYGATMTFAAASTGTAISTLSGAAATNATLAWLGGGSLAAGGAGIAGGMLVLGGLVTGPMLAVMGLIMGAKASKARDEAYSELAKAKEFREEVKVAMAQCQGIRMRADMFKRLLIKLDAIFTQCVYSLEQAIRKSGADFSLYSEEEKGVVASSVAIAKAIKSILDTPILTEDGNLTEESERVAETIQQQIKAYEA